MGLHEKPKSEQLKIVKEFYRILKPEGRLVVWDIMLDRHNQGLFQSIIREKDRLAGFERLVRERYFFRKDEFLATLKKAGFSKIREFHKINYRFSSKGRLDQELGNDIRKLEKLNGFIRKTFSENLKKTLKYKEAEGDITFTITKEVYTVEK